MSFPEMSFTISSRSSATDDDIISKPIPKNKHTNNNPAQQRKKEQ